MADAKISALTEKTTILPSDLMVIVDVSESNTAKGIAMNNLETGLSAQSLKSVTNGGTGANLSTTGGTSQYAKQSGAGSAFTVGAIGSSDMPTGSAGAQGSIEIATQAEVDAGSDTTRAVTPSTLANKTVATANIGEMRMWAITTAPSKWLLCQGQALNRTTYSDLFDIIGTSFGAGNGSTTFNIPDTRGRFPFGFSGGHALGSIGGAEGHTLVVSEMPAHTHTILSKNTNTSAGGSADMVSTADADTSGSTGGDNSHDNMPPYLAIYFIIYTGVV